MPLAEVDADYTHPDAHPDIPSPGHRDTVRLDTNGVEAMESDMAMDSRYAAVAVEEIARASLELEMGVVPASRKETVRVPPPVQRRSSDV